MKKDIKSNSPLTNRAILSYLKKLPGNRKAWKTCNGTLIETTLNDSLPQLRKEIGQVIGNSLFR